MTFTMPQPKEIVTNALQPYDYGKCRDMMRDYMIAIDEGKVYEPHTTRGTETLTENCIDMANHVMMVAIQVEATGITGQMRFEDIAFMLFEAHQNHQWTRLDMGEPQVYWFMCRLQDRMKDRDCDLMKSQKWTALLVKTLETLPRVMATGKRRGNTDWCRDKEAQKKHHDQLVALGYSEEDARRMSFRAEDCLDEDEI